MVPAAFDGGGHKKTGSTPIQHIVVMVQENRTFNTLFATFPGVTGTTTGLQRVGKGNKAKTVAVNLTEVNLESKRNLNHLYVSYNVAYRNGHMDAFNKIKFAVDNKPEGNLPYEYVNPAQVQPYWTIATQ
ncbi:MAG TPA: alkaline phosphatase family protein, partial [Candidatus Cybelea sp.]